MRSATGAPVLAAIVMAGAGLVAGGCGGGQGGDTVTTGAGVTDAPLTATLDPGFRCRGRPVSAARDRVGDVVLLRARGPAVGVRAPGLDLVAASARRTEEIPLCFSVRVAGVLDDGATVSFETIQRAGERYEINRYEVAFDAAGVPHVTRPHGEPRYPVPATVGRRGGRLDVGLLGLPGPLAARFGWRAEVSDARPAIDTLPPPASDRWVAFPSGRVVDGAAYRPTSARHTSAARPPGDDAPVGGE